MAVIDQTLPFERALAELQDRLKEAASDEERQTLEAEIERRRDEVYADLTPWQRVQLARHPQRPRTLDYTSRILDDFIELHGDRAVGDDPAMVCGVGRFRGKTVFVVGQQKGVTTDEKIKRNFGMAHPWGYRKALRVFRMAERLNHPVLTFVDTPAAHPGIEAEQYGQGSAIAQSLLACAGLRVPIFAVILSEGGSGGALAIAMADWVAMFEYAVYMICPPERCAEILWRDVEKRELAAAAMKVTAADLKEFGVIDAILPEAGCGAHRNPDAAADVLAVEIDRFLVGCAKGAWGPEHRQRKYRNMGVWAEASGDGTH
ncbi:MAG TPA: acetyl-CoA carboxylase carboxyltransferase subunit alpha [Candidatus Hydrogenedentes bacterium]|nr:acetyl-CoA carboxylase carboxyltransferase subunit alpha [Candidatus Hydrogenedentota bacterium]